MKNFRFSILPVDWKEGEAPVGWQGGGAPSGYVVSYYYPGWKGASGEPFGYPLYVTEDLVQATQYLAEFVEETPYPEETNAIQMMLIVSMCLSEVNNRPRFKSLWFCNEHGHIQRTSAK